MNEETQQLRAENDARVARRAQSFKGANANEDTTREKLHLKVAPKPNEDNPQPKPQTPARELRWPRLFGQFFRFDKWNLCRG